MCDTQAEQGRYLRLCRESLVDQISSLISEGRLRLFYSSYNSVEWDGDVITITLKKEKDKKGE